MREAEADVSTESAAPGEPAEINNLLLRATQDERLLAVGYCNEEQQLVYRIPLFPAGISCSSARDDTRNVMNLINLPQGPVHLSVNAIEQNGAQLGSLVLVRCDG